MRYQYGMSVGHTYMCNDAFPAPTVPSTGADFDHNLGVQLDSIGGSLNNLFLFALDTNNRPSVLGGENPAIGGVGEGEMSESRENTEIEPLADHFDDMDDRELLVYHEMYQI